MSGLELRVYDALGQTLTGYVAQGQGKEFVDEFNGPGYGKVSVPLDSPDADILVRDAVVKVFYGSAVVFAWFVESLDRSLVDGSGQRLLTASGRGLMAWADDCIIWPQAGLQSYNSPDRPFNYAAKDGYWKTTVTWAAPVGVAWKSDATIRQGQPKKWDNIDRDAQWIWATAPSTAVKEGTINWFRSTLTLTQPKTIRLYVSADNQVDLTLDGATVVSQSDFDSSSPSWSQFVHYTARVGAGDHVIAARVRNGKPWKAEGLSASKDDDKVSYSDHGLSGGTKVRVTARSKANGLTVGNDYYLRDVAKDDFKLAATSGGSAVDITADSDIDLEVQRDTLGGFLFACREIEDGKPTTLLLRSDTTHWEVATQEPKHRPALIVKTLLQEGQGRNVYRLSAMATDFSNTADSGGTPWATEVDITVKVGTTLLATIDQMVDLGADFHVDPDTATLRAWESRGHDVSASVRFQPGNNLLSYSTVSEPKVKTAALVRSKDGWAVKGHGQDTYGRREMYVEVGGTKSESTAAIVAGRVLARTGKQRVTASASDCVAVDGATPYTDFAVGDIISVPSPTGTSWKRARVLSIAMQDPNGSATFTPELEVLDG